MVHIVPEVELAFAIVAYPSLRPDDIKCRSGNILPSEDQVRPELEALEIGIIKTVIRYAIQIFIYREIIFIRIER